MSNQGFSDLRAFLFRLRHDRLLRLRLRRLRAQAVVNLANELGYLISADDLSHGTNLSRGKSKKSHS